MSKEEKLNEKYPFQFYTFSNVSMLEQNGFNFDDYSFNLNHENELYIGNINGLICRHTNGQPIKMLNYLMEHADGKKRKLTFLLPENYMESIENLKGLREHVLNVLNLPCFNDQINILTYKVDNSDIMEKIEELKNMPKFDVAIMNPPYDKSLHLKILEKVIPIANKVVNISPIRWLQDPLAKWKKTSDYKRFENSIAKKIETLDILSSGDATKLFKGAVITIDMAIYVIKNGGFNYKKFNSNILLDKILLKVKKTKTVQYNKITKNFFVPIMLIDGGHKERSQQKSLYNFCRDSKHYGDYFVNGVSTNGKTLLECKNDNKHCTNGNVLTWPVVECNSEREIKNYVNSTKTIFFKFLYKTEMVDVHVYPEFLPFMHSYQYPWTNKRFCEYFGITGFISDTEAVPGSEWEEILNTMKDFK